MMDYITQGRTYMNHHSTRGEMIIIIIIIIMTYMGASSNPESTRAGKIIIIRHIFSRKFNCDLFRFLNQHLIVLLTPGFSWHVPVKIVV